MSYSANSAWTKAFGPLMDDLEKAYDEAYHASVDRQVEESKDGNMYDEREAHRDALKAVAAMNGAASAFDFGQQAAAGVTRSARAWARIARRRT